MAIRTMEELRNSLDIILNERTDDDALAFIEDFTDTIGDLAKRVEESEKWKEKYEQNDREWREKYRKRFFEGNDHEELEETVVTEKRSFDELFEVK